MGLDNNRLEVKSKSIQNLQNHFYQMLYFAFEKNNIEAAKEIIKTLTRQLSFSIDRKKPELFVQFINVLNWSYRDSIQKFQNQQDFLLEEILSFYRSILKYGLSFRKKRSDSIEDKRQINDFYVYAYSGMLDFVFQAIFHKQHKDIVKILENFREMQDEQERIPYSLEIEIENLYAKKETRMLAVEKEELSKVDFFSRIVHFQSALVIQSWLWFLFSLNLLEKERLLEYTKNLNLNYYNLEDLLNDASELTEKSHYGYLGLGNWDYMVRPDGKVYSPPQPHQWINFGVAVYFLRNPDSTLRLSRIKDGEEFYFMAPEITTTINLIDGKFESWKEILGCQNYEEFLDRARILKDHFSQLKKRYKLKEQEKIANQSLSIELIEKFKELIYNTWTKNARIRKIFESNDILEKSEGDPVNYRPMYRSTFLKGGRGMFTHERDNIYGIEGLGTQYCRSFDNEFFKSVAPNHALRKYSTISEAIKDQVQIIQDLGFQPNTIFMAPEYLGNQDLIDDKNFTPKWKMPEFRYSDDFLGSYGGINVLGTYSKYMKNRLMICSLKEAFALQLYQSSSLKGFELDISVMEISDEDAKMRLEQERNVWMVDEEGNELNEQEALIQIKTSVNISIGVRANFVVKNDSAFTFCVLDEKVGLF